MHKEFWWEKPLDNFTDLFINSNKCTSHSLLSICYPWGGFPLCCSAPNLHKKLPIRSDVSHPCFFWNIPADTKKHLLLHIFKKLFYSLSVHDCSEVVISGIKEKVQHYVCLQLFPGNQLNVWYLGWQQKATVKNVFYSSYITISNYPVADYVNINKIYHKDSQNI